MRFGSVRFFTVRFGSICYGAVCGCFFPKQNRALSCRCFSCVATAPLPPSTTQTPRDGTGPLFTKLPSCSRCSCVIFVPVDVVKERLQVQQSPGKSGMPRFPPPNGKGGAGSGVREGPAPYGGSADTLKTILKVEGLRGIYKVRPVGRCCVVRTHCASAERLSECCHRRLGARHGMALVFLSLSLSLSLSLARARARERTSALSESSFNRSLRLNLLWVWWKPIPVIWGCFEVHTPLFTKETTLRVAELHVRYTWQ